MITVPAYFHDGQRRALLEAATGAGLATIRIMNESSAAAHLCTHTLSCGSSLQVTHSSSFALVPTATGAPPAALVKVGEEHGLSASLHVCHQAAPGAAIYLYDESTM